MRTSWLAAPLAAIALALVPPSAAADRFVDDDHPMASDAGACTLATAPCATIGAAVGKAAAGETIRVGGGAYPNTNVVVGGMKTLIGEDYLGGATTAGSAVVTGGNPTAFDDAAIAVDGGDPAARIENLTIRGELPLLIRDDVEVIGNTFDDPSPSQTDVQVSDFNPAVDPAPLIKGNTFIDPDGADGQAQQAIGANSGGDVVITENAIHGFSTGIFLSDTSANPTATHVVERNTITGTHLGPGTGVSIAVQGGPALAQIRANLIADPSGPSTAIGIDVRQFAPPNDRPTGAALERNEIRDHLFGVVVTDTELPVTFAGDLIVGSTTANITANDETATPTAVGDIELENVTLFGAGGPEVELRDANLDLDSSIVGATGVVDVAANGGHSCTIVHSRGPAMDGGAGNNGCEDFQTTADPGFADAAAGDYHLAPASPMIDFDPADTVSAGFTLDIDGDDRLLDGDGDGIAVVDLGADEHTQAPPPVPPAQPPANPPADPAADTAVSLDLRGKRRVRAGRPIKVRVVCPDEACEVKARARFKVPKATFGKGRRGTKRIRTRRASVALTEGQPEVLKLRLKPKARRALKRAARVKRFRRRTNGVVRAAATDAAGNQDAARLRLTLKGKRQREGS